MQKRLNRFEEFHTWIFLRNVLQEVDVIWNMLKW